LLDLGEDRSLLDTLVTMPVVPEFVIPTPGVRSVGVDVEIAALSGMSPQRIVAAVGEAPLVRPLLDNRKAALAALQERLHAVHAAIIAPIWPRLEGVLQGDVERRGRRLVEAGGPRVLAELHADVVFENAQIEAGGVRADIGDRDLVLVPSAFIWPNVYLRDSPKRLALCYPAHGSDHCGNGSTHPLNPRWLGCSVAPARGCCVELERPSTVSELAARSGRHRQRGFAAPGRAARGRARR
jgi:hypothetical protein